MYISYHINNYDVYDICMSRVVEQLLYSTVRLSTNECFPCLSVNETYPPFDTYCYEEEHFWDDYSAIAAL